MSHLHRTFLSVISMLVLVAGCSGRRAEPENAGVEISAPTQLPALLLSELNGDTPRTIRCPVRILNSSGLNQQVVLTGTGCSCYGVVTDDDKPFERGSQKEVASDQELLLAIQGQSPQEESRKTYTADFEVTAEDGTRQVQRILCTQQVYQDFKVVPALIECEMSPNSPQSETREVEITRYYRSDSPTTPTPVLEDLPDNVRLKSIRMVESPTEVETGLWRAMWKAHLEIEQQDLAGSADRIDTLNVWLPSTKTAATPETTPDSVAGHAAIRLVRRSSRPIAYPERIHFGQFQAGTPKTRSLFLVSKDQIPFRVSYSPPEDLETIEVEIDSEPKTSHKLTITLNSVPVGEFSRTLRLNTNLDEQNIIEIELLARILPASDD